MWSVPSRFNEPSTAAFTFSGLLSVTPGPPPDLRDQAELRRHHDVVAAGP
jgi:hypothetical protein